VSKFWAQNGQAILAKKSRFSFKSSRDFIIAVFANLQKTRTIQTLVEDVLRKNASSLETLHFVITRTSEDLEDLQINIPTMPKLQELKVGYNNRQINGQQINVEDLMWNDNIGLN
jgi:hypothetical protein